MRTEVITLKNTIDSATIQEGSDRGFFRRSSWRRRAKQTASTCRRQSKERRAKQTASTCRDNQGGGVPAAGVALPPTIKGAAGQADGVDLPPTIKGGGGPAPLPCRAQSQITILDKTRFL